MGGGPAGTCLSIRLAQMGHRTCLITAPLASRAYRWVSLSPAIPILLQTLGIDLPLTVEPAYRRILWELSPSPAGFLPSELCLVDRELLSGMLEQHARQSGVLVRTGPVQQVERREEGWRVDTAPADRDTPVTARYLVDATGRKGCLPGKSQRLGQETLALYTEMPPYRGPSLHQVEACKDGWLWIAASERENRMVVTAFVDPKSSQKETNIAGRFLQLVRTSQFDQEVKLSLRTLSGVLACDATARCPVNLLGEDWMRVGDAALALDPIAGQGVQVAVTSALQAAIVLNTQLRFPEDKAVAQQFYRERQEERCLSHIQAAGALYASAYVSGHHGRFWETRMPSLKRQHITSPPPDLPGDTELQLCDQLPWSYVPGIEGERIRLLPALALNAGDRPVAFVGNLAVPTVLKQLIPGGNLEELIGRLRRLGFSEEHSLGLLRELSAARLLRPKTLGESC